MILSTRCGCAEVVAVSHTSPDSILISWHTTWVGRGKLINSVLPVVGTYLFSTFFWGHSMHALN